MISTNFETKVTKFPNGEIKYNLDFILQTDWMAKNKNKNYVLGEYIKVNIIDSRQLNFEFIK